MKQYYKYEQKRLRAVMPDGKIRAVGVYYDLRATWVGHISGKAVMYQGRVEYDGECKFFFKHLEHELLYLRRHEVRRRTYRNGARAAVTYRSAHAEDAVKEGSVWE